VPTIGGLPSTSERAASLMPAPCCRRRTAWAHRGHAEEHHRWRQPQKPQEARGLMKQAGYSPDALKAGQRPRHRHGRDLATILRDHLQPSGSTANSR
jgi:hypothetical protein